MNKTSIAWVRGPDGSPGFTWNPALGCKPVSPGCAHCYASRLASTRLAHLPQYAGLTRNGHWTGEASFFPERLAEPLRLRKPAGVFVCDMSDLFHESLTNEQIAAVFGVMAACPQHLFYVLTKRAGRMREWCQWALGFGSIHACVRANWKVISEFFHNANCSRFGVNKYGERMRTSDDAGCSVLNACGVQSGGPLPNVLVGTSVCCRADLGKLDELRETPAARRFVSFEPLLEDLGEVDLRGISWAIPGGESGPHARPCHVDHIRSIVRQCREAGVPAFVKQLGAVPGVMTGMQPPGMRTRMHRDGLRETFVYSFRDRAGSDPSEWPEDLRIQEMPKGAHRP